MEAAGFTIPDGLWQFSLVYPSTIANNPKSSSVKTQRDPFVLPLAEFGNDGDWNRRVQSTRT
jgi:hypothetical protein